MVAAANGSTTLVPNNNNINNSGNGSNAGPIKQQQPSAAGQQQQQQQLSAAGCCPVCGVALRTAHELESHFVWELERLYKQATVAGRRYRNRGAGTPDNHVQHHHHHHGLMMSSRDGSAGAGRLSPIPSVAGGTRDGSLHVRWEVNTIFFS